MTDQDVRDFLERMAAEEPTQFLDAEPLTRRARRRAARTVVVGAIGVAAAIAVLFAGIAEIRTPRIPATPPTPSAVVPRAASEVLWLDSSIGEGLLAVNAVTGEERVLVDDVPHFRQAMLSADGRWAAYEAWSGSSPALWVVGPELEPRKVVQLPDESHRPWAWSSTGALLAVDRVAHLDVIDPATGLVTELDSTFNVDAPPAWSPDGTRVLLGATGGAIHSVDVRTGERSLLVQLPGDDLASTTAIAWSPDGSRFAVYTELGPGREEQFPPAGQLFVMNADGSNIRVLAQGVFFPGFDWSPDGSRITFAEAYLNHSRIWIAPADGSTASLVESSAFEHANPDNTWGLPAWSPDGSQVAFSGEPGRALVINADGPGDAESIDDLTYASWNGGSICWMCLWWINHSVTYSGPSDT
jgi:WD40 repeat protein